MEKMNPQQSRGQKTDRRQLPTQNWTGKSGRKCRKKYSLLCVFSNFFFLLIFHMRKVQPAAGGFGGAMAELQTPLKNNCQTHFSGGRGGWTETAAKQ